MVSVEVASIGAVLFFWFGFWIMTFNKGRVTLPSAMLYSLALSTSVWILSAIVCSRPVVDVSYHDVFRQKTADGNLVDVAIIEDSAGKSHLVNLNSQLGITVPDDGKQYQVARIEYSRDAFGLFLNRLNRYKIVQSNKN